MNLGHYVAKGLNVSCANIAGTVFIYLEDKKEIISLDEVGSFVWSLINGRNSIFCIINCCAMEYDVRNSEVKSDIIEFLQELNNCGIVIVSTAQFEGVMTNV